MTNLESYMESKVREFIGNCIVFGNNEEVCYQALLNNGYVNTTLQQVKDEYSEFERQSQIDHDSERLW